MQTNEKLILADQLYRGAAELQHIKQANILETLKEKGQQGLDYVKDVGGKGLDYIKEKGQQAGEAIGNYRPFDKGDAAKGALIAALLGGGLGAGFGKLRNMMRPEEEQEENSDSTFYGALGALGAATPMALAPLLAGNNPVGRLLSEKAFDKAMTPKPGFNLMNIPRAASKYLGQATGAGPAGVRSLMQRVKLKHILPHIL